MNRRVVIAVSFIFALTITVMMVQTTNAATASISYYVDCTNGNDNNSGISETGAWRSLARANKATLRPGDRLLLKRGCTWEGTLRANWYGTESDRILISAYGEGELPVIRNGPGDLDDDKHFNVLVTGAYQIIEYIETTMVNLPVDANCQNQPVGYYNGFTFAKREGTPNGGSYNILRHSKATRHTIGVHLNPDTRFNRVVSNTLTDNNVMQVLTPISVHPSDDIGAWGVNLQGNGHVVAWNYLSNNRAHCTYDTIPHGNAIELFKAQNNIIHHNTSVDDRVFSEIGGSATVKSDNNLFVYNLVVSKVRGARFIVARGSGNQFGPTLRTKLYNNTIYYTGAESQAVVCGANCSPDILTAKNNIFWAEEKVMYADNPFNESHNLYWSSKQHNSFIQFQDFDINSTSFLADPQFVDPAGGDFRLRLTSPAINAGYNLGWKRDLAGTPVPQQSRKDMGAHEYTDTLMQSSSAELGGPVSMPDYPIGESYLRLFEVEETFVPLVQR